MAKLVYAFSEGNKDLKDLLGVRIDFPEALLSIHVSTLSLIDGHCGGKSRPKLWKPPAPIRARRRNSSPISAGVSSWATAVAS